MVSFPVSFSILYYYGVVLPDVISNACNGMGVTGIRSILSVIVMRNVNYFISNLGIQYRSLQVMSSCRDDYICP